MHNASILCLSLVAAAACAAAPEPPPPLVLALGYAELGTAMAGGAGEDDAEAVRLEVALLDCAAETSGPPADTAVEAILSDRGSPFRAGSPLLAGLSLPDPSAITPTGRSTAAAGLVSGEFETSIAAPGSGLPEFVVVRRGTRLHVGLRSPADTPESAPGQSAADARRSGPASAAADPSARPSTTGEGKGQLVLLRPVTPRPDGSFAVLRRQPGRGSAIALVLRIGAAAPPAELAAVRTQLAAASASTPERATPTVLPTDLAREAVGARPRRHALMAVAARYELPRCLDLLLCVEEPQLIAIAGELPPEPASAWDVERAFWSGVLPAMQRGELLPAVSACLRRHFGAVALDPTALEFSLQRSATAEEFSLELLDDNRRALDARRAKSRVAAAAWLAANGHPIADYDPLAARDDRKAAIRRYEEESRR